MRRHAVRVKLSQEARKILKIKRHEKHVSYHTDLAEAWRKLDEIKETLAVKYSKSLQRVACDLHSGRGTLTKGFRQKTSAWNAFLWKSRQNGQGSNQTGRAVLQSLTTEFKEQYKMLSLAERDALIEEFNAEKATRAKATRKSPKSRANDLTYTAQVIEDELTNLRQRTGTEAILLLVRGTTESSSSPRYYATEGVNQFLTNCLNLELSDLLSRMEAYALNGLSGAACSYKKRSTNLKRDLRRLIHQQLENVAGYSKKIQMSYVNFWSDITVKHRIVIEGWPSDIRFGNLSDVLTSLSHLQVVYEKWERGEIYFRKVSEAEFRTLAEEHRKAIKDGSISEDRRRKERADKGTKKGKKGKKHSQREGTERAAGKENRAVSREFIEDSDEDGDAPSAAASQRPLAPSTVPALNAAASFITDDTSVLQASPAASLASPQSISLTGLTAVPSAPSSSSPLNAISGTTPPAASLASPQGSITPTHSLDAHRAGEPMAVDMGMQHLLPGGPAHMPARESPFSQLPGVSNVALAGCTAWGSNECEGLNSKSGTAAMSGFSGTSDLSMAGQLAVSDMVLPPGFFDFIDPSTSMQYPPNVGPTEGLWLPPTPQ